MKWLAIVVVGLLALLALPAAAPTATSASTGRTCTWGGTPANPTGVFSITPGLTYTPAPSALSFKASGALGGDCSGWMTFTGQVDAGSTCAFAFFDGSVKGLRGVARFAGKGTLIVPSVLYNAAGAAVGVENADILTPNGQSHINDCSTPQGFRGGYPGTFSSVVHLTF